MLGAWLAGSAMAWLFVGALMHAAARRARALGARAPSACVALPVRLPAADHPWRLVVLGDLQRGVVDVPRALVAHLASEPADLVVATGDLAIRGEAAWHGLVQEAFDRAGLLTPLRAVPGNHDLYPSRCRDDRQGGPLFEHFFGPRSWGLWGGPALLVGLDTGAMWRADLQWPRVAAWLAANEGRPWLAFAHRPPWDFDADGAPAYADLAALPAKWRNRPPTLFLAGHLQRSQDTLRDGVRTIVNGAGGDVERRGRRRGPWQLVRIDLDSAGTPRVRTVALTRRRDIRIACDVVWLRIAQARRRPLGALLAAPWRALMAPFGCNVPVERPPRRRAYATREEAAAWLTETQPFAALDVSSDARRPQ